MPRAKKGERFGGRQKGTTNKVTAEAKEMLELAAKGVGGLKALTQFGKDRPDIFWPMWSKLLPKNMDITSGGKPLTADERTQRLDAILSVLEARARSR